MDRIIFRADGNSKIGLGHVMRSLALAEMLKNYYDCTFLIRSPSKTVEKQILNFCGELVALPDELTFLDEARLIGRTMLDGNEIVVLDGYNFDSYYQKEIIAKSSKLVCIDDVFQFHHKADVIINHCGGLSISDFSIEPWTQLCLGPKYALLRKPFRQVAKKSIGNKSINKNVFVCLGGADPNNKVICILESLELFNIDIKLYVVIGSSYIFEDKLQDFVAISCLKIKLLKNLDANAMVKYMSKCAIAITPPSTIAYEYLSVGNSLYLYRTANNQKHLEAYLLENKFARKFIDLKAEDFDKSQNFDKIEAEFDGQQEKRLLRVFNSLKLKVRPAKSTDLMLYYKWINDPKVRKYSYNSNKITLEEHKKWFEKKIMAINSRMYVVEQENLPIGQIRFDLKDEYSAIISFLLGEEFRGLGLGESILRAGISRFKRHFADIRISGFVKKNNIASKKAFLAIGCKMQEAMDYSNSYEFIFE